MIGFAAAKCPDWSGRAAELLGGYALGAGLCARRVRLEHPRRQPHLSLLDSARWTVTATLKAERGTAPIGEAGWNTRLSPK
jgi:hypothetical protein